MGRFLVVDASIPCKVCKFMGNTWQSKDWYEGTERTLLWEQRVDLLATSCGEIHMSCNECGSWNTVHICRGELVSHSALTTVKGT